MVPSKDLAYPSLSIPDPNTLCLVLTSKRINKMLESRYNRSFIVGVVIVQILSFISMILVGVWTGNQLGGFSWQSNPAKEFNYHPFFVIIFICFYGNGMLVYRVSQSISKMKLKIIHAVHFMLCFIFIVIALKAVFDSHDLAKVPKKNMYTLHSWIGLGSAILFSLQLAIGIFMFLMKFYSIYDMKWFSPYHKYFGLTIFTLMIGTCVVGINEKLIFKLPNKGNSTEGYQHLPNIAITGNVLGVIIVIQAMYVGYLITNCDYKRRESSTELHMI